MKTKIFFAAMAIFLISSISRAQTQNNEMKPPSIEERLKMVETKICLPLKLDSNQKEVVILAFKDFFIEMDKLMDSNPRTIMPEISKVEPLEKTRDEKVKQVIADTLFTKYLELEKSSRPPRPNEEKPPKRN